MLFKVVVPATVNELFNVAAPVNVVVPETDKLLFNVDAPVNVVVPDTDKLLSTDVVVSLMENLNVLVVKNFIVALSFAIILKSAVHV